MAQKTENITIEGFASRELYLLTYGALKKAGWEIKYATDKAIVAYTYGRTKKWGEEILIETEESIVHITSKHIHGEVFDVGGKNSKNIKTFIAELEQLANSITEEEKQNWEAEAKKLEEQTILTAEAEGQEAQKIDEVMKFSKGNIFLTFSIIGVNVAVFILMALSGSNIFQPSAGEIIKWGGNIGYLTTNGDWWRLITNIFVHIGFLHLLFNMYGLYFIGLYLERMLGGVKFLAAYFSAGIVASLTSLWWHQDVLMVSAGASGAIFGMFGVFLALLTTNLIPATVRKAMLQSTVVFVGYNLLYGLKGGVDNSAHIGGMLSGMAIGYLYYLILANKKISGVKKWIPAGIILVTLFASILVIQNVKGKSAEQLSEEYYSEYTKTMQKFGELEKRGLGVFDKSNSLTIKEYIRELKEVAMPAWDSCTELLSYADTTEYTPAMDSVRSFAIVYSHLNKEKAETTIRIFENRNPEDDKRLSEIDSLIENIIRKIFAISHPDQN